MGIAAGVVGFVLLALPQTPWQIQILVFAGVSLATTWVWRTFLRHRFAKPASGRVLNRRGASYVGRTFTLKEPIVDGNGLLHVDDSRWKVERSEEDTSELQSLMRTWYAVYSLKNKRISTLQIINSTKKK